MSLIRSVTSVRTLEAPDSGEEFPVEGGLDVVQLATRELEAPPRPAREPGHDASSEEPLGRDGELTELDDLVGRARSGRGRLVLISGEAGVGKTCLAEAVAHRARRAGLAVLSARCWEGGDAPPYWPWVQILRGLLKLQRGDEALGGADATATVLEGMLPRAVTGDRLPSSPADAFRLHDDVVQLLVQTVARRPSLLVLEDVHAASESDLSLLRLLTAELGTCPLVVVATRRTRPAVQRPGVERLLSELLREALHLPLGGLDGRSVADLATRLVGTRPSQAVTRRLLDVTGGNPFFLVETIRSLAPLGWSAVEEAGGVACLPDGVRDAVRRRLDPLPDEVLHLLRAAAVIGREFELTTLQRVTGVELDRLLGAVSVAVDHRVIARPPVAPDRYAFVHALYVEVLYGDLPVAVRADMHRAVAVELQECRTGDGGLVVTEIARHHVEAGPLVAPDLTATWTRRAAGRAVAAHAYPEAARWYERAFELMLSVDGPTEDTLRCALDLADALARARRTADAQATFEQAAELADHVGSAEGVARAALGRATGFGGHGSAVGADTQVVALLERALDRIGRSASVLRVRLLTRLAVELYYTNEVERRTALTDEAVELAARLGDEHSQLVARYGQLVVGHGPDDVRARRDGAGAIIDGAMRHQDEELELRARHMRMVALLESGSLPEAQAELDLFKALAQRAPRPPYDWQVEVLLGMRSFMAGRFAATEQHAHAALQLGDEALGATARVVFGVQMCQLRWAQGRLEEVVPAVRLYLEEYPTSAWAGALGFMEAQLGHRDSAREQLVRLAGGGQPAIARDGNFVVILCMLAMICEALGDADRAAMLLDALSPYAGRLAIANAGAASFGAVSVFVGLAAATTGDLHAAERHLEAGLAQNRAVGDRPLTLWTIAHYVRLLRRLGRQGDGPRADELERELRSSATELGMDWLVERLEPDGPHEASQPHQSVEPDAPAAAVAEPDPVFRPEGEYWTVGSRGRVVRVRDSLGMRYLHRLLAMPGVEIHALDMVAVNGTDRRAADHATVNGYDTGTGPLLDPRAKREYRRRLQELEEELEEATAHNDPERAASCRVEIDALVTELARAVGLGGRDRPSGSASERARVSVTKAIRRATSNIGEHHPQLADHLEHAVRTGTFCAYEDRGSRRWRL